MHLCNNFQNSHRGGRIMPASWGRSCSKILQRDRTEISKLKLKSKLRQPFSQLCRESGRSLASSLGMHENVDVTAQFQGLHVVIRASMHRKSCRLSMHAAVVKRCYFKSKPK